MSPEQLFTFRLSSISGWGSSCSHRDESCQPCDNRPDVVQNKQQNTLEWENGWNDVIVADIAVLISVNGAHEPLHTDAYSYM